MHEKLDITPFSPLLVADHIFYSVYYLELEEAKHRFWTWRRSVAQDVASLKQIFIFLDNQVTM